MSDLAEVYSERLPLLREVAMRLEESLHEHFAGTPRIDRIDFRVKSAKSFVEKAMVRKVDPPYRVPLAEIEDQIGGRILVHFDADVADAVKRTAELLIPVEEEYRRATRYNEFDYESFHGIYGLAPQYLPAAWSEHEDMPQTFELQVRTLLQHAYAEPQHDLAYKPEAPLDDEVRRELAWIAASCWGADRAFERAREKLCDE